MRKILGFLAMLALGGCADTNPLSPVVARNVSFPSTMFANNGTRYRATIANTFRTPVELQYKLPNGNWQVAANNDVVMTDNCNGTLEFKVLENGRDVKSNERITIYKGEATTDAEIKSILSAKAGTGKIDPFYAMTPNAFGKEWDAGFARASDGKTFYVYAIGTNAEESDHRTISDVGVVDGLIVIQPGEDITTVIDRELP